MLPAGQGGACSVSPDPVSAWNFGHIDYQLPSWRPRGWRGCPAGLNLPADHTHNPELTGIAQPILQHASVQIHAAAQSTQQALSSYF